MRHVLVMTGASAVGLLAMFGVDMVDMFFLTMLGEQELAAAVGVCRHPVVFFGGCEHWSTDRHGRFGSPLCGGQGARCGGTGLYQFTYF